jgi:hypothetical protein
MTDLLDGRLEEFGVRTVIFEGDRYLTDGRNALMVSDDDNGFVSCLTRRGANSPKKILGAMADAFDVNIVSEYEPQFWGFATQAEWDAAMEAMRKEGEDRFYLNVMKYVSNESNDIRVGSIGEIMAKIAKQLIENDPDLLLKGRREDLMRKINEIYDRDHAVTIKLSEADIALVDMVATHEDDLPSA